MAKRALCLGVGVLLCAAVSAQFPGRSPGRVPTSPTRRTPAGQLPGQAQRQGMGVPTVDPSQPQGTASRTGTGLGYWDALSQMFKRENQGTRLELGAAPDRAMLLRLGDNVNILEPGHKGWERVYWWKKLRLLTAGWRVTTKHRGRAIQAFHDGAYLDCQGTTTWEMVRLDSEEVRIAFQVLGRIKLEAMARPLHLEIPGGYTLRIQKAIVTLRFDQDRRFFLANLGPGEVRITQGGREIRIGWNECCLLPVILGVPSRPGTLLEKPGGRVFSAGDGLWRLGWGVGAELKREPSKWSFRADTTKARIRWGSCGFTLAPGRTLEVRSLKRLGPQSENIRR